MREIQVVRASEGRVCRIQEQGRAMCERRTGRGGAVIEGDVECEGKKGAFRNTWLSHHDSFLQSMK